MKEIFKKLSSSQPISKEETDQIFSAIMGETEITDAEIGAYLMATGSRLPTSSELIAGATSLRKHMNKVDYSLEGKLVDTCGTGGSGLDTFSVSTASAFLVAGTGQKVAKHGNRAATSRSGSADVLEELGLKLDISPTLISKCIKEANFGFMFAPGHHPATKRVVGIRKKLGFRTIFNFLGPLSNPANAKAQVLGVSIKEMCRPMAEALAGLGVQKAMVVHGEDGLDEITLTSKTFVAEVDNKKITEYEITPEDFGFDRVPFKDISGDIPEVNARRIKEILEGQKSPYRDLVVLNAAAALYIAGKAETMKEGAAAAAVSIDSGWAKEVLDKVVKISNEGA